MTIFRSTPLRLIFFGVVTIGCLNAHVAYPRSLDLEPATIQRRSMHQLQFAGYNTVIAKGVAAEKGREVARGNANPAEGHEITVPSGKAHDGEENAAVNLTAEERAWLAAHPDITFGYTDAFEPEVIVNPDGSYRGILVDVLDLLNQRLGTDFKLTIKPIPDLIKAVSNKELAGVLAIHPDYADKLGWLSTQNHVSSYPTVFARKGTKFTVPTDLAGKKIALIDKVFFSQNLVDLYGDGSTLIKVENALKGLERVKDGTADLFIGASANSYLLTKYQFFDLAAVYQFYEHPNPNGMGVRNDWPQLVAILNKGLAAISAEETESILRKWGIAPEQKNTIELTAEEQDWLKDNPRITVGVSPVPPYMFTENGKVQGSLVDMMKILAKQTGTHAEFPCATIC